MLLAWLKAAELADAELAKARLEFIKAAAHRNLARWIDTALRSESQP